MDERTPQPMSEIVTRYPKLGERLLGCVGYIAAKVESEWGMSGSPLMRDGGGPKAGETIFELGGNRELHVGPEEKCRYCSACVAATKTAIVDYDKFFEELASERGQPLQNSQTALGEVRKAMLNGRGYKKSPERPNMSPRFDNYEVFVRNPEACTGTHQYNSSIPQE